MVYFLQPINARKDTDIMRMKSLPCFVIFENKLNNLTYDQTIGYVILL